MSLATASRRGRPALAPAAVLAALLAAIVCGLVRSAGRDPGHMHTQALPQPPQPMSLWASKTNPLNTYFAKLAWAWTTALFAAALPMRAAPRPLPAAARALASYALATLYWFLMTQWFFGPSLFDRVFVLTGGACQHNAHADADAVADAGPAPLAASSLSACRAAGGWWSGGHDVSGHCFLLLHSALFLTEEVLGPLLLSRPRTGAGPTSSGSSMRAVRRARLGVVAATLALVVLWAAMLFATAAYFHGAKELASGAALGIAYWAAAYRLQS
ncbi:hypothetical protein LPJ56_001144 [Coemansia sp. RSA 2599]|nr:hypothetical protein LPJ56_001144 [Coemansia sp. RSA 2599]